MIEPEAKAEEHDGKGSGGKRAASVLRCHLLSVRSPEVEPPR